MDASLTANAAGPVMAVYLLLRRVQKMEFLGSNAWLFLIINVAKLPFSGALGLVDGPSPCFAEPQGLVRTVVDR